jgi:curved DNA-binding protein CbpA
MKIHSHYENLRVPRDSTIEQIRASYRSLAARFHPDRNPDDPEAERIMKVINKAYEVLSDFQRRQGHDDWIKVNELDTHRMDPFASPLNTSQPMDWADDNFVIRGFALDDELPGQFTQAQQRWSKRSF